MKRLFILTTLLFLSGKSYSQNTPSLWKHTCNCGAAKTATEDANNNVYVFTENTVDSAWIIKISSSGQQLFKKSYLAPGYTSVDYTNAFYKNGLIYFAGKMVHTNLFPRLFIAAIDTSGNLVNRVIIDSLVVNGITGVKSAPYYNFGLYLDQQDNIHIGGTTTAPNFLMHYRFFRFDLNLNLTASYDQPLSFVSGAGPFFVNDAGEVYFNYTSYLCKLDSSYTGLSWCDSLPNYSIGNMISGDSNGNIWMIRAEISVNTFYLHKITDLGNSFQNNYDQFIFSSNTTSDLGQLLINTSDSTAFLAGREYGSFPYIQHVYKLDAMTGNMVWQDTMYNNLYVDLQMDSLGRLLAIGGGDNYYVWYYTDNGNLAFTFIYDGPAGGNDGIHAAIIENNNRLIVTGSASENANTINWATTLKYVIPSISTSLNESPEAVKLHVFPVPASNRLYIHNLQGIEFVQVSDMKGVTFPFTIQPDNSIDLSGLPPGVYTLEAGNHELRLRTSFVKQ